MKVVVITWLLLLMQNILTVDSIRQHHNNLLAPLVHKLDAESLQIIKAKRDRLSNQKKAIASIINEDSNNKDYKSHHHQELSKVLRFFSSLLVKKSNKKKILILMSDTGGGHRASAQAIDQAIQEQYPHKIDVEIMDIWTDYAAYPYKHVVPVYRFLAKHPFLWRLGYNYGSFPLTRIYQEIVTKRSSYESFRNAIEKSNPDLVISVHPLCHFMPIPIVDNMNEKRYEKNLPRIPFITVVTDLGSAHLTWFDKRVDACYVPSETVRQLALKRGIPAERIILRGLPVRPAFWKDSKPKPQVRRKLGLGQDNKTVLLMGGGDGVGGIGAIAEEVAKKLQSFSKPSQLVVICGKNKHLTESLESKLTPVNQFQVQIKGFVDNIDEYMAASDCLITKAGPGTIAEAAIRGLPVILSSYLPGQEYGNLAFVVDAGFGVYTGNRPKKIADTVCQWFQNEQSLERMSKNARKAAHQEATISISKDIGGVVVSRSKSR